MKEVELFTDGACIGNPGPGGWACILRHGRHAKEVWGSTPHTTNNRMELTAAVRGLQALKEPCDVSITTDSEYLRNGITSWIRRWKANGWKTAAKTPVINRDLWEMLDEQVSRHRTSWNWTKGHAGHADNNRCDDLATAAARDQSAGERALAPRDRPGRRRKVR
jgi:ribonuclease HI